MPVELPLQIAAATGVTVIAGSGLTAIAALALAVQPDALVPVTVYVVLVPAVQATVAPVVALRPAAGAQE